MGNVISLLEGEIVKFKLNIERNKKNKLNHIAQYYEELKSEYEQAIEVLKISSTVCGFVSGCEAWACVSGSLHKTAVISWLRIINEKLKLK